MIVKLYCKQCGRKFDWRTTKRGKNNKYKSKIALFCCQVCYFKSLKGSGHPLWKGGLKKKICSVCNIEFIDKWRHNKKTCSKKCGQSYRKNRIKLNCYICKKEYEVSKYHTIKYNSRFCSYKCCNEWKKTAYKGKNSPYYKGGKLKNCKICNKKFWVIPDLFKTKRFCSLRCCGIWRSKTFIGENAIGWKGGITKQEGFRTYYNNKRRALENECGGFHTLKEWKNLKRLCNYKCVSCGKQEPEIKLTEDHIVPFKRGGTNNIENIQPLCKSCNSKKNVKIINYLLQIKEFNSLSYNSGLFSTSTY